jgi:DNA-binding LytR/AlgR family response regulator
MIQAIAVDDEPPALRIIEAFCAQTGFIQLQKTFTMPNEALKYLRKFPVDLLFLDIHMPALSGIDFYKSVSQETMVIFTTAHSQYAVEGFNLRATDYLLKPFTYDRFLQAVNNAREKYALLQKKDISEAQHLLIRADYSLIKINPADILWIEGLDDYLKINLANTKPVVARMTMKAILEKLPEQEFIRVHRSFIVPFGKIEAVRNKSIKIAEKEIPLGSSYEESFFQRFRQ